MLYHKLLHFYLGNRIKQNHYLPAGTVYGKRTKRKKKQESKIYCHSMWLLQLKKNYVCLLKYLNFLKKLNLIQKNTFSVFLNTFFRFYLL